MEPRDCRETDRRGERKCGLHIQIKWGVGKGRGRIAVHRVLTINSMYSITYGQNNNMRNFHFYAIIKVINEGESA